MNVLIYGLILVMMVFICVKNFSLLKRYKFNKKYIACYREMLKDDENAYEHIKAYIDELKKDEYINKARILKLYVELKNDLDYSLTLKDLDIRKIYTDDKGNFDKNLATYNSDTFVFIAMNMTKAFSKLKFDVLIDLYDKVKALDFLNEYVEYHEILSLYDALLSKSDNSYEFLNCLLNGEYTKYKYDKNMIGIYKRIAAAALTYKCQTISDYDNEDLFTFGKSLIGKQMLSDLKLYEKYREKEVSEQ